MNAIRIRTGNHLRSLGIFFPVIMVIMLLLATGIVFPEGDRSGSVSATSVSVSVFAFVLGICSAREDLRLLSQFGISRRTSYFTRLASAALLAVTGAALSELLLALSMAVAAPGMKVADLYQLLYMQENMDLLSFADHVRAFAMNAALMLALYEFGEFFSLAFLRTSKYGAIALGIVIGLLPGVIIPGVLSIPGVIEVVGPAALKVFDWMGLSVWNLVLAFLLWTLVSLVINYLLVRRAPIKPAKG